MNVKLAMVIWLMLVIVVMGTTLIFYAMGAKMSYTEALQYEAIVFGIALLVIAVAYLFSTKSSDEAKSKDSEQPLIDPSSDLSSPTDEQPGSKKETNSGGGGGDSSNLGLQQVLDGEGSTQEDSNTQYEELNSPPI